MSNPFPGMNPYLEKPYLWPEMHRSLIYLLRKQLNSTLPQGFVARSEERIYIANSPHPVLADDAILGWRRVVPLQSTGGGVAVLTAPAAVETPALNITLPLEEIREPYIEIRSMDAERSVVAVIEILSPSNKRRHSDGREQYLRKQHALLWGESHLLEIDLLGGGDHTVAAPEEELWARTTWDHIVSLHHAYHRLDWEQRFQCWPILLRQSLPTIFVPLARDGLCVPIDLQELLNLAHEEELFDFEIDYTQPPPVPLTTSDAVWLDELLREKGLRLPPTEEVTT